MPCFLCFTKSRAKKHAERAVPAGHRRRRKKVAARRRKKPRSGKGFNWASAKLLFCALNRGSQNLDSPFGKGFNFVSGKLLFGCADSRFVKPRISFWEGFNFVSAKLLFGWVDSRFAKPQCSLQGERFYSFRLYEKNGEYPRGLRTSGLRGRFKALSKKILAEFSNGTSRNRLFAQNGGEKALNRCEVQALQRKELERTSKEQPYSLRTVGYGWVEMGGGGRKRVALEGN